MWARRHTITNRELFKTVFALRWQIDDGEMIEIFWNRKLTRESKHFFYHSIKANCWKAFCFVVYFESETHFSVARASAYRKKPQIIVIRVRFLFFFFSFFFSSKFNKNSALVKKLPTKNESKGNKERSESIKKAFVVQNMLYMKMWNFTRIADMEWFLFSLFIFSLFFVMNKSSEPDISNICFMMVIRQLPALWALWKLCTWTSQIAPHFAN